MYNALIIDDEKPVRQVIKALGMWKEMGVEHVFEASEGESALEVMRKNQPEIVFVDMKMPNVNGVDFLKAARKEFPKSKYIVISGYEDFEYTKEAIQSKVLDYLLKPVSEDELNKVLKTAVDELNEEMNRKIENIKTGIIQNISIPIAKERLIALILDSEDPVVLTEEQKSRILGISDKYNYYGVVLFSCVNLDEVGSRFKGDLHSVFFAMTNIINELASEWCNGFSFHNSKARNEIVFVIMASEEGHANFDGLVCEKAGEIISKLEELLGAFCIAGIGGFCREFALIRNSYKSALDILDSVNILNSTERIFSRCNNERKTGKVSFINNKELLIYAFENGSREYARNVINKYFENISATGYLSRDDLYRTAMEFVILIENITENLGISNVENLIPVSSHERTIMSFTKLEDFRDFVFKVVEKVTDSIQINLKANEKANLYAIKDYIDNNYNKEIKLSDFSNKYYISKEYLSKQFKAEFGYGIYEYVLKIRMDKAREMFADPYVKIQAVSEHLGYKDNNYFSRAFKNYFGVSPTEYRENLSNSV